MNRAATITDLTIAAGTTTLLDRVTLVLESGTVTGLVGASGAGKTTLALALLGHLPSGLHLHSGQVRVAGYDPLTRAGRIAIRGRAAAYLPQDPASALDPTRSIAAQLRTAYRISHPHTRGIERSRAIQEAVDAAAFEPHLLTRRPSSLSGGQAQRALLAWVFVIRPGLLILDEPTSSLDAQTALQVSRMFIQLPWRPAVLLISHDRELIDTVSDRVVKLDKGCLSLADTLEPGASIRPPRSSAPSPRSTALRPRPPRSTALSFESVTIRRGGNTVVRDAALQLSSGEFVAIQGRSGSGKTSLARALAGFAPPTAGTLRVAAHPVSWSAVERARDNGPFIAYVGQDARAALHPTETVRRTLQRALASARGRHTVQFQDPDNLLELVNLPPQALDRTPEQLSGGQRHRLVLARAIAAAPSALICDETTAALDRDTAIRILDLLDRLRHNTGLPVLLITHQDAIATRADRVLSLKAGSLT